VNAWLAGSGLHGSDLPEGRLGEFAAGLADPQVGDFPYKWSGGSAQCLRAREPDMPRDKIKKNEIPICLNLMLGARRIGSGVRNRLWDSMGRTSKVTDVALLPAFPCECIPI